MKDLKNMVWMDLEMTGLDPEKDTILEIATIVTDSQLAVLDEGPVLAIAHSRERLESMDPWCVQQHGASGLTRRCLESTVTLAEAERQTLSFIEEHCPEGCPLCGNSIHHDRRFLIRYMPAVHAYLSYRMVDVSTLKELAVRWYPKDLPSGSKKKSHLALDDVRESIAELSAYRRLFFR
ncbi:MAG TPA: oligoribonuclease [Elusimicrobia bacterium]|nr:oligoribonuclease [Elusimicrobiota bacterium]